MSGLTGEQVRVTVEDADGDTETAVIENDYIVVTAGDRYIDGIQAYGNGTQIVTIKRKAQSPASEPKEE